MAVYMFQRNNSTFETIEKRLGNSGLQHRDSQTQFVIHRKPVKEKTARNYWYNTVHTMRLNTVQGKKDKIKM